jgi:hypothetical protein
VKEAGCNVPVFLVNIEFDAETGHDAAEKAEKPVNTVGAVVREPAGMPLKQLLMHGLNMQCTSQNGQIAVSSQVLSLALAELKTPEVDAEQYDPALLSAPLPIVPPEKQICPVCPAILTKTVEHHRVQRLHGHIFLNFCRVEGNIL